MEKLKELRNQRHWSQQHVASVIGCSQVNYGRYENGLREPDIDTLKKLSALFGVSIDFLVGNTSDHYRTEENDSSTRIFDNTLSAPTRSEPVETIALPVNMEELVDLITKTVDQKTANLATKDDVKNIIIQLLTNAANGG